MKNLDKEEKQTQVISSEKKAASAFFPFFFFPDQNQILSFKQCPFQNQ